MSVRAIEAEVSIKSGVQAECTIGREVIVEVHEDVNLESLTVTTNGNYEPSDGVDGFSSVSVSVPERQPDIESLTATANGTYTSVKDGYNPVVVNVPERQPITEYLSVTENGTYTPPAGVDGYSPITVNVPQGSTPTGTKQISITENGTTITDVSDYANAEITVNVPTGGGGGYDDFSGGNIQAIISHGQEYILTDYSGSMQGVFASKFADTNKTSYEGYWSMAYNSNVVGIQRNSNKDNLTIKPGTGNLTGVAYPGYAEGEPITVIVASVSTTNVANYPLVIFGSYYNGNLENTKGTFAFYGLNVFDSNGDLVKKFVPWLNNGVACVKDLVSGTIYANNGTGAFDYIDSEGVTHTA